MIQKGNLVQLNGGAMEDLSTRLQQLIDSNCSKRLADRKSSDTDFLSSEFSDRFSHGGLGHVYLIGATCSPGASDQSADTNSNK